MATGRPSRLIITAAPFTSSRLAEPPSPFSPRLPLSPPWSQISRTELANCLKSTHAAQTFMTPSVSPPKTPLNWVWQCHLCHVRYPLSVTRRCLEDGHFFCAGTTVVHTKRGKAGQRTRVVRRHKACSSEFDYQSWKAWGDWRRNELSTQEIVGELLSRDQDSDDDGVGTFGLDPQRQSRCELRQGSGAGLRKNCWSDCNYPSECRWGRKSQSVSPVSTLSSSPSSPIDLDAAEVLPSTVLMQVDETAPGHTFDEVLQNIDGSPQHQSDSTLSATKASGTAVDAIFSALRFTGSRRKRAGSSSPVAHDPLPGASDSLSSVEQGTSLDTAVPATGAPVDDGDTVMQDAEFPAHNPYDVVPYTVKRSDSAEPYLSMPSPTLPTFVRVCDMDIDQAGGREGKRERKKGYAGYVEALRKMNRG